MGGLAESQLAAAIEAVMQRDSELAAQVVEDDAKVDQLERDLDNLAIRLLALRQPMARDLREIVAALKIAAISSASAITPPMSPSARSRWRSRRRCGRSTRCRAWRIWRCCWSRT